MVGYTPLLWTEFLTHACENVTFPQLLLRTVIIGVDVITYCIRGCVQRGFSLIHRMTDLAYANFTNCFKTNLLMTALVTSFSVPKNKIIWKCFEWSMTSFWKWANRLLVKMSRDNVIYVMLELWLWWHKSFISLSLYVVSSLSTHFVHFIIMSNDWKTLIGDRLIGPSVPSNRVVSCKPVKFPVNCLHETIENLRKG